MIRHYLRAQKNSKKGGFTIVELLIVIIVIAILATITIVSYTAVTDNAKKQTAKTDAQTMATALNKYKADNGAFPTSLDQVSLTAKVDSTFQYTYSNTDDSYCLTASVKGASAYLKNTNTLPQEGGCPGHGINGDSPVTNLASDPRATTYAISNLLAGWRNDRYTPNGTYSLVTNASDGPVSGLNSYGRYTFTQAIGAGRGFHNTGNPEVGTPGTSVGMSVTQGKTYTFSGYVRSIYTGSGVSYAIGVRFIDASGVWIGSTANSSAVAAATGAWVRPTVTATAPTGAVRVAIYIRETAAPTHAIGDTIDGTGLMITEGSNTLNYADGSSTNWVWNGAANGSTSTGPSL